MRGMYFLTCKMGLKGNELSALPDVFASYLGALWRWEILSEGVQFGICELGQRRIRKDFCF